MFASLLLVVAIGMLDYVTGNELRVFPFYYIPIGLASMVGRRSALLVAAGSAIAWFLANLFAASQWSPFVLGFNTCVQAVSFAFVAFMLADLKRRLDREKDLSRTDALTGLLNARAFRELAGMLIPLSARSGQPFVLAFMDLDNFKDVNDTKGHDAGDAVLREAAAVFRESTRASDVLARVGGDEFAIYLPDTDELAANTVMVRLVTTLAKRMNENGWPVTASAGAAVFVEPPATVDAALQMADGLMYRAKKGGKNAVVIERVEKQAASPRRTP